MTPSTGGVDKADRAQDGLAPDLSSPVEVRLRNLIGPDESACNDSDLNRAYQKYNELKKNGEPVDAKAFCAEHGDEHGSLARLLDLHSWLGKQPELWALPETEPPNSEEPVLWPEPGEEFLDFELIRELGKGGFARVYLAKQAALGGRHVVIKVSQDGHPEANILGRIHHDNIVPVYSVQYDPDWLLTAVCMPYLGRTTLRDVLVRVKSLRKAPDANIGDQSGGDNVNQDPNTPAPPRELLLGDTYINAIRLIGAQLSDALHYLHQQGVFHRDLKPSNVLITAEGKPMLLDFNLSADLSVAQKCAGGTLLYMSPEQLRELGNSPVPELAAFDARSELFSLGVMLYELLTAHYPFGSMPGSLSDKALRLFVLERHQGGFVPLRELNIKVDVEFARLVESCLAQDINQRPADAGELAAALRRLDSRVNPAHRTPTAEAESSCGKGAKTCPPRLKAPVRWLLAAAAGIALALVWASTPFGQQMDIDQEKSPALAAIEKTRDAAVGHDQDPNQHYSLGQTAYRHGKFDAAVKHFNFVLEGDPKRQDVLLARARTYLNLSNTNGQYFQLALADFVQADNIKPTGEINAGCGYCIMRLKLGPEFALLNFEKALAQGYATPEVHNNMAVCLLGLSRFGEAERHIELALLHDPECHAAVQNRALLSLKQLTSAAGLQPPTKRKPPPPGAKELEQRCLHWIKQGKADFLKALETEPNSIELNRLAASLWATSAAFYPDDLEETIKFLEVAVANGCEPQSIAKDKVTFRLLADDARYKELIATNAPGRPWPPTTRVVNPLKD